MEISIERESAQDGKPRAVLSIGLRLLLLAHVAMVIILEVDAGSDLLERLVIVLCSRLFESEVQERIVEHLLVVARRSRVQKLSQTKKRGEWTALRNETATGYLLFSGWIGGSLQ